MAELNITTRSRILDIPLPISGFPGLVLDSTNQVLWEVYHNPNVSWSSQGGLVNITTNSGVANLPVAPLPTLTLVGPAQAHAYNNGWDGKLFTARIAFYDQNGIQGPVGPIASIQIPVQNGASTQAYEISVAAPTLPPGAIGTAVFSSVSGPGTEQYSGSAPQLALGSSSFPPFPPINNGLSGATYPVNDPMFIRQTGITAPVIIPPANQPTPVSLSRLTVFATPIPNANKGSTLVYYKTLN